MKKFFVVALVLMTLCTASIFANGSSEGSSENPAYPTKPIVITMPAGAGGGTDLLTRALLSSLKETLGQTVTVVNKTGAGYAIGYTAAKNDKPDGYNIVSILAELLTNPLINDVQYTYKDFKMIGLVNSAYGTISVAADAPYDTIDEFIAYCKANPGKVSFGNSGIGGIWHFVAAAFAKEAGVEITHVPFDGGGPAVTALAGGHVDAVTVTDAEVQAQVAAGKVKILCTLSPTRLESFPDVPTAEECGLNNLTFTIIRGFGAPKDTPDYIIDILADAFKKALDDPEVTKFMESQNYTKDFRTGEELYKLCEEEEAKYNQLAIDLGLKK
ncbi:MAG: tripartite tricarboxylate transporter substrate binding protein [Sphaerochaetaceae bacterium]|nr:tripartite tricarboxylate transporter substrate binding protein [Sphaerochaetaceae bacterium]